MHLSDLAKTYLNSILAGLAIAAFAYGQPEARHRSTEPTFGTFGPFRNFAAKIIRIEPCGSG